MKIKILFAIILTLILVLFVACDTDDKPSDKNDGGKDSHVHIEVIDAAVAPTCTKTGLTEGKHCSVCNEVLVKQVSVAALGHNYDKGVCTGCSEKKYVSQGLEFVSNGDGTCCVSGKGTCTDRDVYIPWFSPEGDIVTRIWPYAFERCDTLISVTIPDSVIYIDFDAFNGCTNLRSIAIPDSVTSLGNSAFHNTAYYNNASNWDNDVLYIGNYLIEAKDTLSGDYTIKSGTKFISDYAFNSCSSLISVIIPDGVTNIGFGAFYNCSSLVSVSIPDSVTSIDSDAFRECRSLTSITLPKNITKIPSMLFTNCGSLISITIPDGVTSIAYDSFGCCVGLTSITIPKSVTRIDTAAFWLCEGLTSITFNGTISEWNKISKASNWNAYTRAYTIYCTDGNIIKNF